jgi:hypothetical protein
VFGTTTGAASGALDRRADQFARTMPKTAGEKAASATRFRLAVAGGRRPLTAAILRSVPATRRWRRGARRYWPVTGLKYAFGRARRTLVGNHAFKPFSGATSPVTSPFLPGIRPLYGGPSQPRARRIPRSLATPWVFGNLQKKNARGSAIPGDWVSDTVAGSVCGYAIGKVFTKTSPRAEGRAFCVLVQRLLAGSVWPERD